MSITERLNYRTGKLLLRIPQIQKLIPKFDSFPASAQAAMFGEFYRGSLTNNKKRGSQPKPKTTPTFFNQANIINLETYDI